MIKIEKDTNNLTMIYLFIINIMSSIYNKIKDDILSTINKDKNELEKIINGKIKTDITKSLCDKSYYDYSTISEISIEDYDKFMSDYIKCQEFHIKKSGEENKQIYINKFTIDEFKKLAKGEKIVIFHLYEMKYINNSISYYDKPQLLNISEYKYNKLDTKIQINKIYQCCCNRCNVNGNFCCQNQGMYRRNLSYYDTTLYFRERFSLQFIFLTNYGKMITNFNNPNKDKYLPDYITVSKLYYNNYYYCLPIDYINIINKCIPYEIYNIMELITTQLYNRTTYDNIPTDIEIENMKIEQENKKLEKEKNIIEDKNNKLLESINSLYEEYNELIEIEKKYNKLMEDETITDDSEYETITDDSEYES